MQYFLPMIKHSTEYGRTVCFSNRNKLTLIKIYGWSYTLQIKTATALVLFNGVISQTFRIGREVGQGRVLSAWLFSVYINGWIHDLLTTKCGLNYGSCEILTVLSANGTTLLSTTINGSQKLSDIVHEYEDMEAKIQCVKKLCFEILPQKKYMTVSLR